eukprot:c27825_g1_i3 orf=355-2457(-)
MQDYLSRIMVLSTVASSLTSINACTENLRKEYHSYVSSRIGNCCFCPQRPLLLHAVRFREQIRKVDWHSSAVKAALVERGTRKASSAGNQSVAGNGTADGAAKEENFLILNVDTKEGKALVRAENGAIVRSLERSYRAREVKEEALAEGRAAQRDVNAVVYDPAKLADRYRRRPFKDALPTFLDAAAFSCIENELGMPLQSIFSAITPTPTAAASLGQVYKACLKYSGELVAVKVQRPGIEEAIGLDFFLLRGLCHFINENVDTITSNVVALLDEFAYRVYQELNYVQEARNAVRFRQLYGDRPDVFVPGIFWNYTSVKVLTMQWVEGTKLSEQSVIQQQGLDIVQLVNIGIQCSLRQLLEHGYFHADPHPGNLLATSDGKLAFVDFGMMSETPQKARFAIIGHVVHLVNRDYEAMARDYYALDFISADIDVSPIAPALRNFFDDVLSATVSDLNFKTIVDGLGAVLYQYPFDVPAYYALILRSLTVLEGLALYTDPNFKVLSASYPYFAKRLLTDPSPYLRDALIELLFKDGKFRWNRLENLLVQGRKDSEFAAKDALQSVLKLLLGPDGEELRILVVKEAIQVAEALIIGTAVEGYNAVPEPVKALFPGGNITGILRVKERDLATMLNLRAQVLRVWGYLQSSSDFDPALLQPVVEVLKQPGAQAMGGQLLYGLTQRLTARLLQQVLRPATSPSPLSS